MDRIVGIAQRHRLGIVEDCAQANGGEFHGKALGTFGQAGAFSLQHYKIITAGEGGAVITDSKEVFERAAIFHDSAYAFWMERTAEGTDAVQDWKNTCFLGENYRQSELHGALALEQLKKRDRILERTRAIKRRLWPACEAIPGAQMEAVHDREGDCGISLVFFMENPAGANAISEALRAEGVHCGTLFSKQIPDRHIFYHWDYVMKKRTPHRNGFPWISAERPCAIDYTVDMCPKSINWLERSVMMPITQVASDAYVDQVVRAIEKVARHW
jgi:8-amino-3,8-dideoxy-alpha-D-manno-octulosonate transaminase